MNGELAGIAGPGTAFIAGLVTSLHCAGMCGPLACALLPVRSGPGSTDPRTTMTCYHLARVGSYTVLGALAGAFGRLPLSLLNNEVLRYLPWAAVLFFLAVALRLDQRLPKPAFCGRVYGWIASQRRNRSPSGAAALLGFATPLLPCGPLYFLISLAVLSGSALHGAETLLAFGLGTIPLLWFAQANFHWLRGRLGPVRMARMQTLLGLLVAAVLAWRLRGTLGFTGSGANDFVCF
jgi:sulfite exporter TauE/SafE